MPSSDHLTSYLKVSSWKWPKNCIFDDCFIEGSIYQPKDIGSWTLAWTMVSDLYSHILNKNCRERLAGLPLGHYPHQEHWKKSGHVRDISNDSSRKTLFNYVDQVIWYGHWFRTILWIIAGGRGLSPNQNIWKRNIWSCDTSNEISWETSKHKCQPSAHFTPYLIVCSWKLLESRFFLNN